jgi:hypothetical protein
MRSTSTAGGVPSCPIAELFVAIRENYLNVYWNGNSLLKLRLDGERLVGETHYKYLLQPDAPRPYVSVVDGVAAIPDASALFLRDIGDVQALKRAATVYGDEEKAGVHRIVRNNPGVIDVEVAFGLDAGSEAAPSSRRIDFAALRPTAKGAEIAFYEAKLFANKDVRAAGDTLPRVIQQIAGYRQLLNEHRCQLMESYRKVCGNLAELRGVRERYTLPLDTMREIFAGERALHVSDSVSLVVFGFDADQRDGANWKPHRGKLEESLGGQLIMKGKPADVNLSEL